MTQGRTAIGKLSGLIFPPEKDSVMEPFSTTYIQRGGYNSEVLRTHRVDGKKIIEKLVGAKRGGLTFEGAETIAQDVMHYQRKLEALGVPMPELVKVVVEYDLQEKVALARIHSLEAGYDVQQILEAQSHEPDGVLVKQIVLAMCEILKCVCRNRISTWETRVGIDPKASNFNIDFIQQRMYYVDPYPPRYRKGGKPIIEWHPLKTNLGKQLGYFKYYDVRGIVLGFISQLSRVKPALRKTFEDVTLEAFGDIVPELTYGQFLFELSNSPWHRLRSLLQNHPFLPRPIFAGGVEKDSAQYIIEQSLNDKIFGVDYNIYTLREIALELAYAGMMSSKDLETFFKASHFEEEMPQGKLETLQAQLCSFLKQASYPCLKRSSPQERFLLS